MSKKGTVNPKHSRQRQDAEGAIGRLIADLRSVGVRRLPTETELMNRLALGRYTVRQAVEGFVSSGILERIQGKGTFILDAQTEISFSGWIGTEPPGDEAVEELVSGFRSRNPDIAIAYKAIPYYQSISKILYLAVHGAAPDVIQLTPPILGTLHDMNLLMPLDEHVNHGHLRRRYPVDVESGRIGRELYAVTWGIAPLMLYYNKNVFLRAGLDPGKPPRTLDELHAMCVRINGAGDGGSWGISLPLSTNDPNFLWLYPYFLSFGGGFVDTRTGNVIIDGPQNVAALGWLAGLFRDGAVPSVKDITEGRMLFASDRIGFWVDGPWLRGLFRQLSGLKRDFDAHYGVAKIPAGPSGRSESILWNHSLAISTRCRHVEQALKWIDYLTTDEESVRCHFRVLGMLPSLRDFLHTPFFSDETFAATCIDQMETVSNFPLAHPLFTKSVPFISQVISSAIAEGLDPAERLSSLKEIIQIINQNRFLSIYSH